MAQNAKRGPKWVFGGNPATRITNVAGDHGAFLPLLVAIFGHLLVFSSLTFFLVFLYNLWHDFPTQNLMRSRADQRINFFYSLGKPKTLSCRGVDLPLEAKTGSNDVGMS